MVPCDSELQHQMEERLRFESLLTEISARFINLPSDQIDSVIEDAQRRICQCLGLDLSALWQWAPETPRFLTLTHLHSPPEGPARPLRLDAERAFPWQFQKMLDGETLAFSTEDMPPEAAVDQDSLRYYGIKSSVVIPLSAMGGPLIGVLSFDALHEDRAWPLEMVKRLALVAQVFFNALSHKHAEEALRISEARLQLAADSAEAGLWELDCDTRLFWTTERARAIFGYSPEDDISMERFESSVHPDDIESVREAIARALNESRPLDVEYRIRLEDGPMKWISSRGRPYFSLSGEPRRLVGVSIDISRRKEMERELHERLKEIERLKDQLENENMVLREDLIMEQGFERIIGNSKALKSVLVAAQQVASTDSTVLILGETGTGKGLVANAIHQMSARKDRPLVTVNCCALPRNLFESELFGHEKGAFTGAHSRRAGRFEVADGGTLFLDEIGEMPWDLQSKLLRALQEGELERLGSNGTLRVDVRVIAATSRDLKEDVRQNRFRRDLFYRLNVFPIWIPPLRQRTEDISSLAQHFAEKYARRMGKKIEGIPKTTLRRLMEYDWPGNVRELEHVIERSVILAAGPFLHLSEPLRSILAVKSGGGGIQDLATAEREHILRALCETGWRIEGPSGAASILKLNPSTLRFRIKKLGIRRPG